MSSKRQRQQQGQQSSTKLSYQPLITEAHPEAEEEDQPTSIMVMVGQDYGDPIGEVAPQRAKQQQIASLLAERPVSRGKLPVPSSQQLRSKLKNDVSGGNKSDIHKWFDRKELLANTYNGNAGSNSGSTPSSGGGGGTLETPTSFSLTNHRGQQQQGEIAGGQTQTAALSLPLARPSARQKAPTKTLDLFPSISARSGGGGKGHHTLANIDDMIYGAINHQPAQHQPAQQGKEKKSLATRDLMKLLTDFDSNNASLHHHHHATTLHNGALPERIDDDEFPPAPTQLKPVNAPQSGLASTARGPGSEAQSSLAANSARVAAMSSAGGGGSARRRPPQQISSTDDFANPFPMKKSKKIPIIVEDEWEGVWALPLASSTPTHATIAASSGSVNPREVIAGLPPKAPFYPQNSGNSPPHPPPQPPVRGPSALSDSAEVLEQQRHSAPFQRGSHHRNRGHETPSSLVVEDIERPSLGMVLMEPSPRVQSLSGSQGGSPPNNGAPLPPTAEPTSTTYRRRSGGL